LIQRIQSRSAFTRIRSEGVHLRSGVLSCTMILDSSLPGPQVGYAFSRKFGSAVRRNRIRRQLRELVKIRETQFPAGVFVFGASPRASQTPIEILARDLDGLLAKVAR
jgi:ribonuclease P protein component